MNELDVKVKVQGRLDRIGIRPNEGLGQHFIINPEAIRTVAAQVEPEATVVEVGAGVGQLTEAIATTARKTIAIELDRRFAPVLDEVSEQTGAEIVYGDALTFPWMRYTPRRQAEQAGLQVVSNLPYHISEPFMRKLILQDIDNAILFLGKRLIDEMMAVSPNSADFGMMSVLAQSFFNVQPLMELEQSDYLPAPRTKSGIVKLTPKPNKPGVLDRREFVFRALFSSEKKNPSVASVLKDALLEFERDKYRSKASGKREGNRQTRRESKMQLREMLQEYRGGILPRGSERFEDRLVQGQARVMDWIRQRGIAEDTLHKPFRSLTNPEIRILAQALI